MSEQVSKLTEADHFAPDGVTRRVEDPEKAHAMAEAGDGYRTHAAGERSAGKILVQALKAGITDPRFVLQDREDRRHETDKGYDFSHNEWAAYKALLHSVDAVTHGTAPADITAKAAERAIESKNDDERRANVIETEAAEAYDAQAKQRLIEEEARAKRQLSEEQQRQSLADDLSKRLG